MKDNINKVIIALMIGAIVSGAGAVVKVRILENDMSWIKDSLKRIEKNIGNKCQ